MKTTLQQKLNTYGRLAKGVAKPVFASVAALAAADAQAQITNIGSTLQQPANASIDLNNDGTKEFDFVIEVGTVVVKLQNVGGILTSFNAFQSGAFFYPLALAPNVLVGASDLFGKDNSNSLTSPFAVNDQWAAVPNGSDRYLGLKLNIGGVKYGWIRLTKTSSTNWTVQDWAYKTDGGPILTGQTFPVELTAFRAQIIENAAQLFWSTESEENNAGFEVQRSTDGKNFETLDFVEGHGTTYEAQEYIFDDKTIRQNTTYYYRLKQMDFDGKFEYTDVVTARIEGNANAGLFYPNPAIGGATKLNYATSTSGKVNVTVYNISGQAVTELVRNVESGSNVLEFDFSALSKGNYFVKLENGSDRQYQKLVIE
jgi:hypothetical protein